MVEVGLSARYALRIMARDCRWALQYAFGDGCSDGSMGMRTAYQNVSHPGPRCRERHRAPLGGPSCYAARMLTQKLLDDPPAWYPAAVFGGMFLALLMVSNFNKDAPKRRA